MQCVRFSGNLPCLVAHGSGAYSGTKFNIHEDPERFFRMLCGYVMMSDDELGLDTFTQHKDGKMVVTMPADIYKSELTEQELELHPEPIAHQRAIVYRATTCFLAKPSEAMHKLASRLRSEYVSHGTGKLKVRFMTTFEFSDGQ
ncbi:hypothetical protein E4U56_000898 [Claviceps arundinis]|uniref:Fungal-type protein kinase domain-containing protein n=1 Tax=Claviceps arundinis TaxID=1623583 RepID=A0A9P7MS92_9HYPO|nr:hypothetical protein E4U56_000898 [Claviceps arundinis]